MVSSPTLARTSAITLVAIRPGIWRVIHRSGTVLGHIERSSGPLGDSFAARRLTMASRRIELGTFWQLSDAEDCFR